VDFSPESAASRMVKAVPLLCADGLSYGHSTPDRWHFQAAKYRRGAENKNARIEGPGIEVA
jgi:hypothetical protein